MPVEELLSWGNLHKCFSHTFQFIKEFLLQQHCKMPLCACVKLVRFPYFLFFFSLFNWVGITSTLDCVAATQTAAVLHPPSSSMFWCSHISMFMVPTKLVLAGPTPFPLLHAQYIPITLSLAPSANIFAVIAMDWEMLRR